MCTYVCVCVCIYTSHVLLKTKPTCFTCYKDWNLNQMKKKCTLSYKVSAIVTVKELSPPPHIVIVGK